MKSTKPTGSQRYKTRAMTEEHTPIQTRVLNVLRQLEQLEQLNPLQNTISRDQFIYNFNWTDSILQP